MVLEAPVEASSWGPWRSRDVAKVETLCGLRNATERASFLKSCHHWDSGCNSTAFCPKTFRQSIWMDGIINSTDMSLSKLQEVVKDRETWRDGTTTPHLEEFMPMTITKIRNQDPGVLLWKDTPFLVSHHWKHTQNTFLIFDVAAETFQFAFIFSF